MTPQTAEVASLVATSPEEWQPPMPPTDLITNQPRVPRRRAGLFYSF